jgi:hypothetical protein
MSAFDPYRTSATSRRCFSVNDDAAEVRRCVRAKLAVGTTLLTFCFCHSQALSRGATRHIDPGGADESAVICRCISYSVGELRGRTRRDLSISSHHNHRAVPGRRSHRHARPYLIALSRGVCPYDTEGGGRSLRIDSRNQPGTARERLIDFDADRLDDGAPFDDF